MGVLNRFMPTFGAQSYAFKPDGLLHFVEGRRGRGKSYTLATITRAAVRAGKGVRTNSKSLDYYRLSVQMAREGVFPSLAAALEWVSLNVHFMRSWDDLLESWDCFVLIDECTRLFDGRPGFQAQKTPTIIYDWFQQSRKLYVTTWLAGHSLEWLDKKVAQLVDVMWMSRKETHKKLKAPDGTPLPTVFWLYGMDPGGAGKTQDVNRNAAELIIRNPFDVAVATLYNSWEMVNLIGGEARWNTVQELEAYHASMGRLIVPEPEAIIRGHLERLRADDGGAHAPAPGALVLEPSQSQWGPS